MGNAAGEGRARSLQPTSHDTHMLNEEDDEATALVDNDHSATHEDDAALWQNQKSNEHSQKHQSRSLRPVSSKGLRIIQQ